MANIFIENLDVKIERTVTEITLIDARSVERTDTGVLWKGGIQFSNNGFVLSGVHEVIKVIRDNSEVSWVELDAIAQASHNKNYADLTMGEGHQIHGQALASKMVNGLVSGNVGFTVGEAVELVTAIVTALA